jgi:hypothetical protein
MGLEKMTLNNMVQDPSMIHETVTYGAFHAMGVPAPHTGFTYLTVNGKSYGVHLNIEMQDVQSVENAFGTPFSEPPQHLYEGEYGADVSNSKWEALEVSEGKKKNPGDKADLEAFVAAVESSGGFAQRVAAVADLNEMTKDAAPPTSLRLAVNGRHVAGKSISVGLEAPGRGRLTVTGMSGEPAKTVCSGAIDRDRRRQPDGCLPPHRSLRGASSPALAPGVTGRPLPARHRRLRRHHQDDPTAPALTRPGVGRGAHRAGRLAP